jgi:hypothetical protein
MGHSYFYAIEGTDVHPVTEGADNPPIGLAERLIRRRGRSASRQDPRSSS